MNSILSALISTTTDVEPAITSTGAASLDACLSGGWRAGEWHELMGAGFGVGEFSALLPVLAAATQRKARVALIHPPYQPYAPALQAAGIDVRNIIVIEPKTTQAACWAAEHCLRALAGGVVVVWTQESTQLVGDVALRRLRKAAQVGRAIGIALRPAHAAAQPSPAGVRLAYESATQGLVFQCLKTRYDTARGTKSACARTTLIAPALAEYVTNVRVPPPLYLHSPLPALSAH